MHYLNFNLLIILVMPLFEYLWNWSYFMFRRGAHRPLSRQAVLCLVLRDGGSGAAGFGVCGLWAALVPAAPATPPR